MPWRTYIAFHSFIAQRTSDDVLSLRRLVRALGARRDGAEQVLQHAALGHEAEQVVVAAEEHVKAHLRGKFAPEFRADLGARAGAEPQQAALVTALAGLEPGKPLRGVFHAAGVLDDGLISGQTPDRLRAVLAPKPQESGSR